MEKFNKIKLTIKSWGWIMVIILVYCLWIWWPTRELPYHWDSAGFFINSTRELQANNFWPWIAEYSDFAHPPLMMTYIGLGWRIWGESLLVSHMLMLVWLPLLMWSTFLIANKWMGKWVGLGAALLVGTTPFVLAEVGTIYIDLPAGALAVAALASILYRRVWLGILFLVSASLVKETALLVWPAMIWAINLGDNKSKGKNLLKIYGKMLIPLLVYGGWLVYHYWIAGWWIVRPGRETRISDGIGSLVDSIGTVVEQLFFFQGRWGLSLMAIFAGLYLGFNYRRLLIKKRKIWLFFTIWLIPGMLFFGLTGEFGLRYGIFLLPGYVVLSLLSVSWLLNVLQIKWRKLGLILVVFVSMCLTYVNWYPDGEPTSRFEFRPPADLSYINMVRVGQEAALYLMINFGNAEVYGAFPENLQLTQPYQGYVDKPFEFYKCSDFTQLKDNQQIIYVHPYSPEQIPCLNLIKTLPVQLLKRFESRDKWVELYKVKA